MANKSYKYKAYPTPEQSELFHQTFGCVRFVYNQMLNDRKDHILATGKTLKPTPARYKSDFPFLNKPTPHSRVYQRKEDWLICIKAFIMAEAAYTGEHHAHLHGIRISRVNAANSS